MNDYFVQMKLAMNWLAEQDRSLFLGQSVAVPGTVMRGTLEDVEENKLIELPVDEELQMGMSIGFALNGFIPISVFPRWNFLLVATNQVVNHLDKLGEMLGQTNQSKVIIRTGIGSINPLNPGPQHIGDFTDAFKLMCNNVNIVQLNDSRDIFPAYREAYLREDGVSSILIERSDNYND